jgi:hypothetical protein
VPWDFSLNILADYSGFAAFFGARGFFTGSASADAGASPAFARAFFGSAAGAAFASL